MREYANVLRRRWWLVAITLIVVGGATAIFTLRQENVYEARAQLFVGQQSISAGDLQFAQNLTQASLALVKSYATAITTRPIAQDVTSELGIESSSDALLRRVTAEPIPDTQIIDLRYQDTDPARAAAVTNAMGTAFIRSLERIDPSPSGAAVRVSMLEPAVEPSDPVSPRPLQNALGAFVVAGLLAFAAVLVAERLDSTIKSREDVEASSGRPVLAVVPHVRTPRGAIVNAQGTPAGEAYRALRSAVQHAGEERRIRTLAVTSPEAGDGKTSTSFNLAAAFAEGGVQAYLVEADMRKPTLARNLNYQADKGLGTILAGKADLESTLRRSPFPFLHVVPAGQQTKEAGELLLKPELRDVLEALAANARIVLVDTPPILAVSDAAAISKAVDGFLLVVRAGKTKEEQLREAMRILNGAGAEVVGIVVNDLDRSQALGYGYGYYGYGGESSYGPSKEAPELTHRARSPRRDGA